jgi:hypothetical protein
MRVVGSVLIAVPFVLLLGMDYWTNWRFWLAFDLCAIVLFFGLERLIAWDVKRQGF